VFRAFTRHQVNFAVQVFVPFLRLAFEHKVFFNCVERLWL
jgi:hypothetical protein